MLENLLQYQDIYLRALEPEDLDFLYQIENDTDIWQHGSNKTPLSRFCLKQYLENSLNQTVFESGELRLVVIDKHNEESLGFIDLFDFDHYHGHAALGIVIKKEKRGRGIGRMALRAMMDYAQKSLHLHQLSAQISVENVACCHLFIRAGFTQCGLLKDWNRIAPGHHEDVAVYQFIFGE